MKNDSFSISKRYLQWKNKREEEEEDEMEQIFNFRSSSKSEEKKTDSISQQMRSLSLNSTKPTTKKKLSFTTVTKLRAALSLPKTRTQPGLGPKVVGTLFGHRRGHVYLSFQEDYKNTPPFLVELATPTSILVKEMASGLVRIALESDKRVLKKGCASKLLEEPVWRTYCNGKKCGYALRRECGVEEWKVLNAVGPISMGAGVLPRGVGAESDFEGEMMYMRAKFERVVGSRDSEAYYMVNPEGNGGPELSIYLLRV